MFPENRFSEITAAGRMQGCCVIQTEIKPKKEAFDVKLAVLSWQEGASYCLVYSIGGKQKIEFFKDAFELSIFYGIHQSVAQTDQQDVIVDYLYMWANGPELITDIVPHILFH